MIDPNKCTNDILKAIGFGLILLLFAIPMSEFGFFALNYFFDTIPEWRISVLWKKTVRDAKRVFVVGIRFHSSDAHIWGELAKTNAPVWYVGSRD